MKKYITMIALLSCLQAYGMVSKTNYTYVGKKPLYLMKQIGENKYKREEVAFNPGDTVHINESSIYYVLSHKISPGKFSHQIPIYTRFDFATSKNFTLLQSNL